MDWGSPFLGIDFGTSQCTMAWYNPATGRAQVIRNSRGNEKTPSIVYLGRNESEHLIGEPAQHKLLEEEKADFYRFVIGIKRNLVTAPSRNLDGHSYSPVTIASKILKKLKEDAEKGHFLHMGFRRPVSRVVITHPASFDTLQLEKLKEAATLAGFRQVALLPEPEAAALAYGYSGLTAAACVLIYDFGGGTFDVAVLKRLPDGRYTIASQPLGYRDCGGEDLDRELYDHCNEIALQQLRRGVSLTGDTNLKFLDQCRLRKENLSYEDEVMFSSYLPPDNDPVQFRYTLKKATFEAWIRTYIDRTITLSNDVINEARARNNVVNTVVLIGGSSRVPLVGTLLRNTLQMQILEWEQRDIAVALGAAYHAQVLWGAMFQQYYLVVNQNRASIKLTPIQIQKLEAEASKLGLHPDEAANIECNILGFTKETILQSQEYQLAVQKAWRDQFFSPQEVKSLVALREKLGLSVKDTEAIECQVAGYPIETILRFQEYRAEVETLWKSKFLTEPQVKSLSTRANALKIPPEVVTYIERLVMGQKKETILLLQAYRASVSNAWQDKFLSPEEVTDLKAKAIAIRPEDAEFIERQEMGRSLAVIVKMQNYRAEVKKVWKTHFLTQTTFDELKVLAADLNKVDAESIEKLEMGDTKENIMKSQHQEALQKYRAMVDNVVEKVKVEINDLSAQAITLGLSKNEALTIEREVMGPKLSKYLPSQSRQA
jgi:Hsp70 protein